MVINANSRAGLLVVATFIGSAAIGSAALGQTSAPRVIFEGVADETSVAPNQQIAVAFEATLPNGYHVNSNAPLEEFLRPTRLLLEPPEGVAVTEISYPEPLMFKTQFSEQPLAVYEHRFRIAATLAVADLPAGEYTVPATLKYQACSERICYPPATRTTEILLRVGLLDK